VDVERTLETQQLKLLRIIAGLAVVLGVLAVGPVSRWFSEWTLGFVGSVLSRAEAAARYLFMTQAYLILRERGVDLDRNQISEALGAELIVDAPDVSLPECRRRLKTLRALLMDLPRHALHLLRRIEKRYRRAPRSDQNLSRTDMRRSSPLNAWRKTALRVERPPDKNWFAAPSLSLPPDAGREAMAVKPSRRAF